MRGEFSVSGSITTVTTWATSTDGGWGGGHLTPTDDVELLHLLGCGGNKMNNEAQPGRKEASDRLMPPPTQEACHISHRKWGPSHRQTGWPTLLGAPTQVSTC